MVFAALVMYDAQVVILMADESLNSRVKTENDRYVFRV